MANIHTFSDYNKAPPNNQGRNIPYAPLGFSQPAQTNSNRQIVSFGYPNSEDYDGPRMSLFEVLFPSFSFKSFVFIITMVQIVVFIITEVIALTMQDSDVGFTCVLYKFGGKYTPSIVTFYHAHRLLLPTFLHAGVAHIFFNMLSQWFYGFKLEETYTVKRFALLYFVAGIGGNLLSAIQEVQNISVGASSSLFGLFALQIVYIIENYDNLGPRKNIMLIYMAFLIVANLGTAHKGENVDNSAHMGGFIVGALIAILYMQRPSDPSFYKKKIVVAVILAAYFAICTFLLATKPNMETPAVRYSDACNSLFYHKK